MRENTVETLRQKEYIDRLRVLYSEKAKALGRPCTYHIETFGCQMNAKDSEKFAGILQKAGCMPASEDEADFVLYNTCTVRENANLKVYGHLGKLRHEKKSGRNGLKIALCGCMMQEPDEIEKILKEHSFVDLIFGTHNIHRFAELVYRMETGNGPVVEVWPEAKEIVEDLPSERKYRFKAGVNIMFGCNNFCSYCIVPYVRGRERSREASEVLSEIERLSKEGVREVMLLGQNVNSYGNTLEEKVSFAELLKRTADIPGIERIRFMTSHPKDLSDELIRAMTYSEKICNHFHLPLQSGSDRILKEMNRHYDRETYLKLVEKLRRVVPEISITTDLIVGFPGETEEDFQDTLSMVETVRYASAFTFLYSRRTGTKAASLPGQVPEDVAKERFERLLKRVQEIGQEESGKLTGKTREVLAEERNQKDPELFTGRLTDNTVVHFKSSEDVIGKIVPVKLLSSKGFYYLGVQDGIAR